MVCIPCLVVPALLFIWYRFLQPIFLRFWNPFGKVEAKNETSKEKIENVTESSAKKCPFSSVSPEVTEEAASNKKDD